MTERRPASGSDRRACERRGIEQIERNPGEEDVAGANERVGAAPHRAALRESLIEQLAPITSADEATATEKWRT